MSLNEIYKNKVKELYETGIETSPRGMKIKELLAQTVVLDPNDNIITVKGFETNLNYAKEELNWYLSGSNSIYYSELIKKIWTKYSDDGFSVNSAYGHRIFGRCHGYIDQFEWCLNKLIEDKDSRQAVININDVSDKLKPTKDMPCTLYLQFFIRDSKLCLIANMRSNDVFYGFRNDIYCFTEIQKLMAKRLNIETGNYYHFAGSLHLYEKDFEKVRKLCDIK